MLKQKVTLFFRKPNPGNFSIEQIFTGLFRNVKTEFTIEKLTLHFPGFGVNNRLRNILWVRKQKAAVYHITGDINYISLALAAKKTVLTIHDCGYMHTSNPLKRFILDLFWIKLPAQKVKYITAVSQIAKEEFVSYAGINPNKVHVIYNYVDPAFQPSALTFNKVFRILHIGTKANKNLTRLIGAITGFKVQLVVIGKLNNEILKLLTESKIEFTNQFDLTKEALIKHYVQCDLLCFASTHEGFGMPIIEAQAIGRPVLTSNISSMPEVAGEGALFVDPYSIDSIKKGILSLMENEKQRDSLIQAGFKNVKRFQRENIAAQYITLYKSIIKKN